MTKELIAAINEVERLSKTERDNPTPLGTAEPLMAFLDTLPPKQLQEITAVYWMGRDDFARFQDALEHAARIEALPVYLSEKPLHKYLRKGISAIANEPLVMEDRLADEYDSDYYDDEN